MPLVSVIIANYNHAPYLDRAIRSLLDQTWPHMEVIVVDDNSTDATPEILRKYEGEPRVRVLCQENQGLARTRNNGIAIARGEYIGFLDADDYFAPEKIEKQVLVLQNNPEYDWVYCDMQQVHPDGSFFDDYSIGKARPIVRGDILPSLLIGGYFPPHVALVRRSLLEEVGVFTPDLDGHADYDLWMRAAARGKQVYYLDERLAYYTRQPGSMSTDWDHMSETRLAALTRLAEQFPGPLARSLETLFRHVVGLTGAANSLSEALRSAEEEKREENPPPPPPPERSPEEEENARLYREEVVRRRRITRSLVWKIATPFFKLERAIWARRRQKKR
ncbi:MAG: glycosyltransferase [Verrucomicrobium sp.]|nr:glycosyltransferase [Verrucomicrobium sp.]